MCHSIYVPRYIFAWTFKQRPERNVQSCGCLYQAKGISSQREVQEHGVDTWVLTRGHFKCVSGRGRRIVCRAEPASEGTGGPGHRVGSRAVSEASCQVPHSGCYSGRHQTPPKGFEERSDIMWLLFYKGQLYTCFIGFIRILASVSSINFRRQG